MHTLQLARHAHAVGETVTLRDFPEEGAFQVTKAQGHNLYNSRPCYQLTGPDGETFERITEDRISRKP